MLARWIATVAALLLACASPQADAYVRAERVSVSLADLAVIDRSALAAENASPAKAATNPKTAPPARAKLPEAASGKNAALSHCRIGENWSPLQQCASMPGVYQWDGTRLAGRTNATGSTLGDYQHAYGWAISSREGAIRSTLHTDVHGTPQLITDGTAAIAGWTRTDVWGVEKAQSGVQSRLGHTGYLKDPLLGDELYAQARQYRAGTGRFTSRDEWSGDNLNPITLNKYLYGNGNPGSFWDLDGLAAAPPCANTPAGCVSPEQLRQRQMLSEREATTVAGLDFEAPPEVREEPKGPGLSASTEPTPKNAFEANAWRSRQMRYEGTENSLGFDDRVGNVVALVCPWCTEKNELGVEQKVNPINRERLSTEERDQAFSDGAGIAALGVEYYGGRLVARTLVEGGAGNVSTRPSIARESTPKPIEPPYGGLSKKRHAEIRDRIDVRTATREEYAQYRWNGRFNRARREAVADFWVAEREGLQAGGPGTRNWSEEQKQAILAGRPARADGVAIEGHHRYSARAYPQLARDPEKIYPATRPEHIYRWHGGSTQNATHGEPLNPSYPEEF